MPVVSVKGGDAWKKKVQAIAQKAGGHEVQVGIPEGATSSHGTPMAQIGAAHEYGTATVPQRSFLRSTLAERKQEWRNAIFNALKGHAEKVESALDLAGQVAALDIQVKIEGGIEPALKDATIKRKTKLGYGGHAALPLVLTGEMLRSIAHQVVRK